VVRVGSRSLVRKSLADHREVTAPREGRGELLVSRSWDCHLDVDLSSKVDIDDAVVAQSVASCLSAYSLLAPLL
jgi:hypothetical protein